MPPEQKAAKLAPSSEGFPTRAELVTKITAFLGEYSLPLLPDYTIVVEGTTDVAYLHRAAELALAGGGEDILAVPVGAWRRSDRILVCTPTKPGGEGRGGTPLMVRLAHELRTFVFGPLELFSGLVFVFDHDDAGLQAQDHIESFGYRRGRHSISLDPRAHPGACGTKQVTVEDLLPLGLQKRFFETGGRWCDATYQEGEIIRFKWHTNSKSDLRDFTCEHGTLAEFGELVSVLRRARRAMSL